MKNLTPKQKEMLIELINQRISAVYIPKGTLGVDGQTLKQINKQLEYRQQLIEIRKVLTLDS